MPDTPATRMGVKKRSRRLLAARPLPLPISILARTRTCSAITPALWIHVGVGRIVGVALRAVRLLGLMADPAITRGVPARLNRHEVRWIAASPMRAFLASGTLRRVMARMVNNHPFRHWPPRRLVCNRVRLVCLAGNGECAISLGEGAIPGPARVGRPSIDEGFVTLHRVTGSAASPAAKGRAMPTQTQVVGIAQSELLNVQGPSASADAAYLLRHV